MKISKEDAVHALSKLYTTPIDEEAKEAVLMGIAALTNHSGPLDWRCDNCAHKDVCKKKCQWMFVIQARDDKCDNFLKEWK